MKVWVVTYVRGGSLHRMFTFSTKEKAMEYATSIMKDEAWGKGDWFAFLPENDYRRAALPAEFEETIRVIQRTVDHYELD